MNLESRPNLASIYPNNTFIINPGDKTSVLLVIQAMMSAIGNLYSNIPKLRVTGIHYDNSIDTVRALQEVFDQPSSGIIDKMFWNSLTGLYELSIVRPYNIKLD